MLVPSFYNPTLICIFIFFICFNCFLPQSEPTATWQPITKFQAKQNKLYHTGNTGEMQRACLCVGDNS